MNEKNNEALLRAIGGIDEGYIREYLDTQQKGNSRVHRLRFAAALAAAMIALAGVAGAAFYPVIGHFLESWSTSSQTALQNFAEIEAGYAARIEDGQECNGLRGTLNSAIVEDRHLLLSYTFDWSNLEEARDGSFHTWFLPWFFQITEGDRVICSSEYTEGLHTQSDLAGDDLPEMTVLYSIDLGDAQGQELLGKELTVRLLYSENGEGFVSTFTPEVCFADRQWSIDKTYEFDGNRIVLNEVRESALYVTLFLDCETIGHSGDEYTFMLSDEEGNDYPVYPNEDNDANGYWFVKPEHMGTELTLKVIRSRIETNASNEIVDDSYEVLYTIPIKLNASLWEKAAGLLFQ